MAYQRLKERVSNLPSTQVGKQSIVSLSTLQLYLKEITKYPLLSPEEEYQIALEHFDMGSVEAAQRLVTSNLRLVVKIANEFKQAQTNLLDLIQEGNFGLMQAVKRFNPYKGVKLSTYSAWWIKAYILKYLMDNRSQVKMGTTAAQRKLYFNLRKETERLLLEYDSVGPKLLAESLQVKENEVVEMQQRLAGGDLSLDAPLSSDGQQTHSSQLMDDKVSIEDQLASDEVRNIFREHLDEFRSTLSGRDLEVFDQRLLAENPKTLQEIGDIYGITRERARQIEARLVKKLQDFVRAQGKLIDL
jgi:RNA polymerase sigma-32 factor